VIERLVTTLRELSALSVADVETVGGRRLVGDCADALRLELDCPQQSLTKLQRAAMRRLSDLLEGGDAAPSTITAAARDAYATVHGSDRIVIIAAGFGVWHGGKCLASGRWTDIVRVRTTQAGASGIELELRNGTRLELYERTPGWDDFLGAAQSRMPGMPSGDEWRTMVTSGTAAGQRVLYDRSEGPR
jgi:hypothetical protein